MIADQRAAGDRHRVPRRGARAAPTGETDPARRAGLHDRESDRARDDPGTDRLPPRQAVVARHGLYPAVSEFLAGWARSEPGVALFRIAAPENSPRAHKIRDLLTRFNTPFTFHPAESEEGAALLDEVGQADCTAADGRSPRRPRARRPDGRRPRRSARRRDQPRLRRRTTSRSSAPGLPAFRPPSTRPRRGSRRSSSSGQISAARRGSSSRIRNVPGFAWGIGGRDLATARASRRGCSERTWCSRRRPRRFMPRVTGSSCRWPTAGGHRPHRRARHRRLVAAARDPGLEALIGAGVFYGAASSEARAMRGKHVSVVGGGNAAGQAAAHLRSTPTRSPCSCVTSAVVPTLR